MDSTFIATLAHAMVEFVCACSVRMAVWAGQHEYVHTAWQFLTLATVRNTAVNPWSTRQ